MQEVYCGNYKAVMTEEISKIRMKIGRGILKHVYNYLYYTATQPHSKATSEALILISWRYNEKYNW